MLNTKLAVKRALIRICQGLERYPRRNFDAIVTLMHEVGVTSSDYNIEKSVFSEQLNYLLEHKATWYKATALAKNLGRINTNDSVCVTFDDGTLSSYHATIELVEAGASCTHFIIPDRVNRKDGNSMSWSQIKELDLAGVEIGSHSLNHAYLPGLGERELEEELSASKNILENKLGKPVTSFAYPYGCYNKRVIKAVEESGYECAFTTRHLYATNESDVFQIPRFEPLDSVNHLIEIFQGQGYWFYRLLNNYYKFRDQARS